GGELDAGQQPGDDAAVGQRVDIRIGEVGAVVGCCRAGFAGDLHARPVSELIGVYARRQARTDAGGKDGAGGVGIKSAVFTEDVDPFGVRCAGFKHGAGHQVDVVVDVRVFGHHVGAQECGLGREL